MAITSIDELFGALERGDTSVLLGTPESEWLDFKREPYRLQEDSQKFELAKDVAAFANHRGGIIVIGVSTEKDPTTATETAKEIRPIPKHLISFQQYRQVITSWTYPPIRDLRLKWYETSTDHGLLTIHIPAAPREQDPILVVRTDRGKTHSGALVGIYRRTGDNATPLTYGEIHQLLRDGTLLQRVGWSLIPSAPTQAGAAEEERHARLLADTQDAGLNSHRRYFLQAWPNDEVEVQDLYSSEPYGFRYVLANPPEIRAQGFGLRTYDLARVLPGGVIRTLHAETMALSLQRNGLLTWVVTAGPRFLSWAAENRSHGPFLINPLALVESTLEYFRLFVGQVLPRCEPSPSSWTVVGGLADLREGGKPSLLAGGTYRALKQPQPALQSDSNIGPLRVNTGESVGRVTFRVLRDVYATFGLSEKDIPYAQEGEIHEKLIRHAGNR